VLSTAGQLRGSLEGGKRRRGKVLCSGTTCGTEVKQDGKKEPPRGC
jgi:hypothetical protein